VLCACPYLAIEEKFINLFTLLAIAAEATDTVPVTMLSTANFGEKTLNPSYGKAAQ
jgi:hypothetical protein